MAYPSGLRNMERLHAPTDHLARRHQARPICTMTWAFLFIPDRTLTQLAQCPTPGRFTFVLKFRECMPLGVAEQFVRTVRPTLVTLGLRLLRTTLTHLLATCILVLLLLVRTITPTLFLHTVTDICWTALGGSFSCCRLPPIRIEVRLVDVKSLLLIPKWKDSVLSTLQFFVFHRLLSYRRIEHCRFYIHVRLRLVVLRCLF